MPAGRLYLIDDKTVIATGPTVRSLEKFVEDPANNVKNKDKLVIATFKRDMVEGDSVPKTAEATPVAVKTPAAEPKKIFK